MVCERQAFSVFGHSVGPVTEEERHEEVFPELDSVRFARSGVFGLLRFGIPDLLDRRLARAFEVLRSAVRRRTGIVSWMRNLGQDLGIEVEV